MATGNMLRVTLRRSGIGYKPVHRKTLRALGLRRIGQSRVLPDNDSVRGMIRTVDFLVETEAADATNDSSEE
jgi:large subunit ribosomal protein L30